MYKDFTSPAEAMRRERYRVATTKPTKSNVGRGLQTKVGHALVKMVARLLDSPVARTPIEGVSV